MMCENNFTSTQLIILYITLYQFAFSSGVYFFLYHIYQFYSKQQNRFSKYNYSKYNVSLQDYTKLNTDSSDEESEPDTESELTDSESDVEPSNFPKNHKYSDNEHETELEPETEANSTYVSENDSDHESESKESPSLNQKILSNDNHLLDEQHIFPNTSFDNNKNESVPLIKLGVPRNDNIKQNKPNKFYKKFYKNKQNIKQE